MSTRRAVGSDGLDAAIDGGPGDPIDPVDAVEGSASIDSFAGRASPGSARPPTILDLAAAAGVSKATASRVINDSPAVAPETRTRVLAAVDELGFQVNRAARSLRTSRTGLVGVLVPVISVFGRIVEELDPQLAEAGLSILLTASRRRQPELDLDGIEVLVGRGVDALVLAPSNDRDPDLPRVLGSIRIPIVLLDREVEGLDADLLLVDQRPGIDGALDHLLGEGRRRIGLLTRDEKTRPGRQILVSYAEGVRRSGVSADDALVQEFDDLDRGTARDGVDALLETGADAIISTGTMEHTATVLERLAERDLAVPRSRSSNSRTSVRSSGRPSRTQLSS